MASVMIQEGSSGNEGIPRGVSGSRTDRNAFWSSQGTVD